MTNHTAHNHRSSPAKAGSASSKTMSGKAAATDEVRKDVYQVVTDSIVAILEKGARPWAQSWSNAGGGSMPLRHGGDSYRGINVLILWGAQAAGGYQSPYWMTYRQASELGGRVRKGEKGTMVVYYGTAAKQDAPDTTADDGGATHYRFLKTFAVFNADQIEGLPARYTVKSAPVTPAADRIPELESMVAATGAAIHHGGNRAFYRPGTDTVTMPAFEQFRSPEFYYATLFHELAHWTKAPDRLARDFGSTSWGDEGYAKEELVAELASAFLGAEFGFAPEHIEDHASYLASWLKALRNDKRLIFMAAAKAQAAADFIVGRPALAAKSEAA
jgi:antirestriction protein ArdC